MPHERPSRALRLQLRNIEALCFDFDGIIRETEPPWHRACSEVYEAYGYDLPLPVWGQLMTSSYLDAPARRLAMALGDRVSAREWRMVWGEAIARAESEIMDSPILPGVVATMENARTAGIRTAIVTNANTAWLERWLPPHVANLVDVMVTRDHVVNGKPSGEGYRLALRALRVAPGAAVGIEDSPAGAEAVMAAGMTCVVVPSEMTRQLAFPAGVHRAQSLETLAPLLGGPAAVSRPVHTDVAANSAPGEVLFA